MQIETKLRKRKQAHIELSAEQLKIIQPLLKELQRLKGHGALLGQVFADGITVCVMNEEEVRHVQDAFGITNKTRTSSRVAP